MFFVDSYKSSMHVLYDLTLFPPIQSVEGDRGEVQNILSILTSQINTTAVFILLLGLFNNPINVKNSF